MKVKEMTRREFLKDSSSAAIAGSILWSVPGSVFSKKGTGTRVVLVRNENLLDNRNKPRPEILEGMLDEAVTHLYDNKNVDAVWKKLFEQEDIVGIKTNVWHYLPTPDSLEKAIKQRLIKAGVKESNIGIRDRGLLRDKIFKKATALINVRPLRTHHWSGVGSLIKNYITFVDNPSHYHPDTCADLASIWKQPLVSGKTRLNILVMFTPLFHGIGPHHYNPKYTWRYQGLLAGNDPVAVDATGVRILQTKRREFFEDDQPINPSPKHVFLADTRHKLGTADPRKIELVKLGWKDDILI